MSEQRHCPNCGRPASVEYRVEEHACQLWRQLNCNYSNVDERAVADCFGRTARRIKEMTAQIAELTASNTAAKKALARHHAAQNAEMFPDGARIE